MMTLSHLTFRATTVALTLCTADPKCIAVGEIAGTLPDLDTPNSIPGRLLALISAIVSKWGHR